MRWLGISLTFEELQDLIALVDNDVSGVVDFDELLKIVRKYEEDAFKQLRREFAKGARVSPWTISSIRKVLLPELGFTSLTPVHDEIVKTHLGRQNALHFGKLKSTHDKSITVDVCDKMIAALREYDRNEFRRLHGFSTKELANIRESFDRYDNRSTGFIDQRQMPKLLAELFPWATNADGQKVVKDILSLVDKDGDGKLDWSEFIHLMRAAQDKRDHDVVLREKEVAAQSGFSLQSVRDLRQVFNAVDTDGSKSLEPHEFLNMILSLIEGDLNRDERDRLQLIINEVDEDGSNSLGFAEFMLAIRRVQDEKLASLGI